MSARKWHGVEPENTTRRKLQNGFVVKSYGGAFKAGITPIGVVREKCVVDDTWETSYRTPDEYMASLFESLSS